MCPHHTGSMMQVAALLRGVLGEVAAATVRAQAAEWITQHVSSYVTAAVACLRGESVHARFAHMRMSTSGCGGRSMRTAN